MKIGIFDSGLGGLFIAKAIRKTLPTYDYVYLGDTKRVPYGNRSHESVFEFTKNAVDYLFTKEQCELIVIACNTASSRALCRIQQEYLPKHFPNRRVLGVIAPTVEDCVQLKSIGILATTGTVASNNFPKEIRKVNKTAKIFQNAAPMLVPLVENLEHKNAIPFLKKYITPLAQKKIDALVLGCTHYPYFKKEIKKLLPKNTKLISQDEIIPKKLKTYLARHTEIEKKLSKKGSAKILVTDKTESMHLYTKKWFGADIEPELVKI